MHIILQYVLKLKLLIYFRIDRNLDGSQMGKLASKDSSRDIADSDTDKDSTKITSDRKPKETPPILKYIKTQVRSNC